MLFPLPQVFLDQTTLVIQANGMGKRYKCIQGCTVACSWNIGTDLYLKLTEGIYKSFGRKGVCLCYRPLGSTAAAHDEDGADEYISVGKIGMWCIGGSLFLQTHEQSPPAVAVYSCSKVQAITTVVVSILASLMRIFSQTT